MIHHRIRSVAASAALMCIAAAASAGSPPQPVTYHVGGEHVLGCFAPCMCPLWLAGDVDGSFNLTLVPSPLAVVPFGETYDVTDLSMTLTSPDGSQQDITGAGTYRVNWIPSYQHRLELDLMLGGETQHFDSGLVPGGEEFPDISIGVAINGSFVCFTSVFYLDASPQPVAVTADLNGDGIVNSLDLGILLSSWSIPVIAPGCAGDTPCPADLNHDGRVDSLDLGMLLSNWTL